MLLWLNFVPLIHFGQVIKRTEFTNSNLYKDNYLLLESLGLILARTLEAKDIEIVENPPGTLQVDIFIVKTCKKVSYYELIIETICVILDEKIKKNAPYFYFRKVISMILKPTISYVYKN